MGLQTSSGGAKRPLHLEKVAFCLLLWSNGIVVPYFFENDKGRELLHSIMTAMNGC